MAVRGDGAEIDVCRRSWPSRLWPAGLAVLVAAATVHGLADGRDVAPVLAASGFVYLAAAVAGRRWAAWPAFGVSFVLITIAKLTDVDATAAVLGLAVVLVVAGFLRGHPRPAWSMPMQTAAMVVMGGAALLVVQLDRTAGGLLVALALLAHAAWDLHHHRRRRVVSGSLAEFCGVLDVLLAVLVAAVTLAG